MSTARREDSLQKAIECVEGGATIRQAAAHCGVPYSILQNRLCFGRVPRRGPPTLLSKSHEDSLADWVLKEAHRGFPINRKQLCDESAKLFPEQFKNGRPGRRWVDLFLKRHPAIAQRVAESINGGRACVTEPKIRSWFGYLREYLEEQSALDLLDEPARILM